MYRHGNRGFRCRQYGAHSVFRDFQASRLAPFGRVRSKYLSCGRLFSHHPFLFPRVHADEYDEFRHPRGRQPRVFHDFHAFGRRRQHHSRSRFHLRAALGNQGRRVGDGDRSGRVLCRLYRLFLQKQDLSPRLEELSSRFAHLLECDQTRTFHFHHADVDRGRIAGVQLPALPLRRGFSLRRGHSHRRHRHRNEGVYHHHQYRRGACSRRSAHPGI